MKRSYGKTINWNNQVNIISINKGEKTIYKPIKLTPITKLILFIEQFSGNSDNYEKNSATLRASTTGYIYHNRIKVD